MNKMLCRLACFRCGAEHFVELDITVDDNGEAYVGRGTLRNDWALRWRDSHQQPAAFYITTS